MGQPTTTKDPNTAMVIEIVAGYLGLLGMGYIYAGRTAAGLLRLVGFWVVIALIVIVAMGLSLFSIPLVLTDPESALGADLLSLLCMLCLIPVVLATPIVSGLMLKRSMS